MPIYAYKCDACGHRQDVLQKMSDPVLTACPACGKASFAKQLTAPGFQLKGSGWYATDFRNNGSAPAKPADKAADKTEAAPASSACASCPAKPADTSSSTPSPDA